MIKECPVFSKTKYKRQRYCNHRHVTSIAVLLYLFSSSLMQSCPSLLNMSLEFRVGYIKQRTY